MTQRVKLGRSDLSVSRLCFGGNIFGWTVDEATSFRLLDGFVDAGFNFIDTADVYSKWHDGNKGGESEAIIGAWAKSRGNRDKIVIATKVGSDMGGDEKGLSKAYILRAVDRSLKRLQTDYIDLYQSHWDDLSVPVEEALSAYAELIKAGKVRVVGCSNFNPERLKAALEAHRRDGLPRYESLQPEYNLCERAVFESELAGICSANQIGVISYFSLAGGFLTGKYRSKADLGKSARGSDVEKYLDARGQRILAALDDVAAQYKATPARVAIAWLLAQPVVTAPIASATSAAQLAELTAAAQLTLDATAVQRLNTASAPL
ncbi:aldo/keto reductase [Dongia rigui]|uniref:Aldo/keto reductase n=1 Tax=Dongia rigui TaxID=940149 RepID=A0ABU5E240_9PROT|nr:aldo/keto reductase [Dongia rigui]MDY0873626.1 aldo/keto reductase [Dongia rigui]